MRKNRNVNKSKIIFLTFDKFLKNNMLTRIKNFSFRKMYYDRWERNDFCIRPGSIVLDEGCGEGRLSAQSNERGAIVYGTDIDLNLLKTVNKTCSIKNLFQSDIQELPLKSKTVDFIILGDVLEHVYKDTAVMDEARRVLKDSGRILISVPSFASDIIYWLIHPRDWFAIGAHVRIYTRRSLMLLLKQTGFKVISRDYVDFRWTIYLAINFFMKSGRISEKTEKRLIVLHEFFWKCLAKLHLATVIDHTMSWFILSKSTILVCEKNE